MLDLLCRGQNGQNSMVGFCLALRRTYIAFQMLNKEKMTKISRLLQVTPGPNLHISSDQMAGNQSHPSRLNDMSAGGPNAELWPRPISESMMMFPEQIQRSFPVGITQYPEAV